MESFKWKSILFLVGILFLSFELTAQATGRGSINTIVIDAGHGGKDPGTHGNITNEKTVVLGIALKLGEFISEKYPHIKIIYTRKTDTFITLGDRAEIANRNDADLFICIHANSAGASAAYGTEAWVLGLSRTKAQQHVAERENSSLLLEKNAAEKYKNFNLTPDAIIARKLQLSIFLDHSIDFAAKIEQQFKASGRHDRGVKQAGFYVLYKTTMPSVLIETGFLTNPKDEHFLSSKEGQIKTANDIFKAFQEYYSAIEGVNDLVEDGKTYKASIQQIEKENESADTVQQAEKDEKGHVYFKVQIATSSTPVSTDDPRFKNLNVNRYEQNGVYKYTSGLFKDDLKSAVQYKHEMSNLGYKDAFVVAFVDGKRVSLSEARKLLH